jgi:hypothetical protein
MYRRTADYTERLYFYGAGSGSTPSSPFSPSCCSHLLPLAVGVAFCILSPLWLMFSLLSAYWPFCFPFPLLLFPFRPSFCFLLSLGFARFSLLLRLWSRLCFCCLFAFCFRWLVGSFLYGVPVLCLVDSVLYLWLRCILVHSLLLTVIQRGSKVPIQATAKRGHYARPAYVGTSAGARVVQGTPAAPPQRHPGCSGQPR